MSHPDFGPLFSEVAHRVHRDDPDTSREAAVATKEKAAMTAERTLVYLASQGLAGATHFEVDEHYGWPAVTASRALTSLHYAGLIYRLKERRAGDGHRASHVYVSPGNVYLRELLPVPARRRK